MPTLCLARQMPFPEHSCTFHSLPLCCEFVLPVGLPFSTKGPSEAQQHQDVPRPLLTPGLVLSSPAAPRSSSAESWCSGRMPCAGRGAREPLPGSAAAPCPCVDLAEPSWTGSLGPGWKGTRLPAPRTRGREAGVPSQGQAVQGAAAEPAWKLDLSSACRAGPRARLYPPESPPGPSSDRRLLSGSGGQTPAALPSTRAIGWPLLALTVSAGKVGAWPPRRWEGPPRNASDETSGGGPQSRAGLVLQGRSSASPRL